MPFLDNKLTILTGKCLGFLELAGFHAHSLSERDVRFDFKNSFATPIANMHVDGSMIIAVEEKTEAVSGENSGHWENQ